MFRPIIAVDDLRNLKDRMISFEDDSSKERNLTLVSFPKGRATIMFNGILYDWYGREVELDERIERIVAPFGHYTDGIDLVHCHDNFVVELDNGLYAVLGIRYRRPTKREPDYNGLKYAITAGSLDMIPYIGLNDVQPSYEAIDLITLDETCFKIFTDYHNGYEFAIGKNPKSEFLDSSNSYVIINGEVDCGNNWLWMYVANSKEELMSIDFNNEKHFTLPCACQIISHFNDLEISDNGGKISIIFPDRNTNKALRASTDKEILHHTKKSDLWWYLDP